MDVSPDKQNLDQVFANTTYYIDFYQRQYKWDDVPVKRLLDDIFYKFCIDIQNIGIVILILRNWLKNIHDII